MDRGAFSQGLREGALLRGGWGEGLRLGDHCEGCHGPRNAQGQVATLVVASSAPGIDLELRLAGGDTKMRIPCVQYTYNMLIIVCV